MLSSTHLQFCADRLRTVTQGALQSCRPLDPTLGLEGVIRGVRAVSAKASETMRDALSAVFPDIGWLGEASEPGGSQAPKWICDPIDGAYHYVQGLPLWSASLALVGGGRTYAAWVYDPAADEMFMARAGGGATLNGHPIQIAVKQTLSTAVVGTAIGPIAAVGPEEQAQALRTLGLIAPKVFVVRAMAAASLQLAYVAAGRLDGYWELGEDVEDWTAGALLVREAGGMVNDLLGREFGETPTGILAGSSYMTRQLGRLLT